MATVNELKATARARAGKGAARAVRREGRVPGVIYGDNQPPMTISLDYAELRHRIMAGRFLTSICNIEIDGQKHRTIPRDFQLDPVRDTPMHVDFLRLGVGATIRVRVPVHVMNVDQSPGVKRGGAVNIVTHHVEVVCAAENIPESIDVDIQQRGAAFSGIEPFLRATLEYQTVHQSGQGVVLAAQDSDRLAAHELENPDVAELEIVGVDGAEQRDEARDTIVRIADRT